MLNHKTHVKIYFKTEFKKIKIKINKVCIPIRFMCICIFMHNCI